jgi:hypothetical protein
LFSFTVGFSHHKFHAPGRNDTLLKKDKEINGSLSLLYLPIAGSTSVTSHHGSISISSPTAPPSTTHSPTTSALTSPTMALAPKLTTNHTHGSAPTLHFSNSFSTVVCSNIHVSPPILPPPTPSTSRPRLSLWENLNTKQKKSRYHFQFKCIPSL